MAKAERAGEQGQAMYWNPSCKANPVSWHIGDLAIEGEPGNDSCGISLTRLDKPLFIGELPTEFFNHQLMGCDAASFDSVCSFISTWGLPYSPYRYSSLGFILLNDRKKRKDAKRACELTDKLAQGLAPVVSLAEARHTIECLQNIVLQMRRAIRGEPFDDFTVPLNAASCNGLTARIKEGSVFVASQMMPLKAYWEKERLTCAICNQILESMADENPWKECANTTCDVVFKHRQPKDGVNLKPNVDALYCCEPCKNTQSSRNKRHPHIDHGL